MRPVGWRFLRALSLGLILALIIACGGNSPDLGNPDLINQEGAQVRGMVLEVVGRNIVELETLRIRDASGREWTFGAAQGFIGLSPSHLREHQLAGKPVLVTFVTRDGRLLAVDITD